MAGALGQAINHRLAADMLQLAGEQVPGVSPRLAGGGVQLGLLGMGGFAVADDGTAARLLQAVEAQAPELAHMGKGGLLLADFERVVEHFRVRTAAAAAGGGRQQGGKKKQAVAKK